LMNGTVIKRINFSNGDSNEVAKTILHQIRD